MGDIQTQIELEWLYNKNQTMKRLRAEFDIPEIIEMIPNSLDKEFVIDLLAQMVLHRKAAPEVLIGILWHHFKVDEQIVCQSALQMCSDALLEAAEKDLVDYQIELGAFTVKWDVTPDVREDLDRFQYPLPMVIEPNVVRTNRETGYVTSGGSIILRDNHHDDDVCLDHINRVNKTRLVVNPDTARMIQNQWADLDKQRPCETPTDFAKRKAAFEKYDRISRDVIESMFMSEDGFYLTHKYDKRGRTYAQGYHINPQGNTWNKAVVEFAHREVVLDC